MVARPVATSSYAVGDIRLTMIADGYHRCDPLATFADSSQTDWDTHAHLLDERGRLVMTMGALLVELPTGQRALIDVGFGPRTIIVADAGMEFWGGRMLASLAAVGLAPSDIDAVLYSHLHLDHVGWTTNRETGTLTFERARHVMTTTEYEHWRDHPGPNGPSRKDMTALADRVELFDGEAEVMPGVSLVPTPGHTPGHCSYLVTSGRERAVILGDAIHCPLQITHPEWAFAADTNPDAARRAREALLRELDAPETTVVGPHFPDAIFGRVLPGTAPRQVAFDIAIGATPQSIAPEAVTGDVFLPPLT